MLGLIGADVEVHLELQLARFMIMTSSGTSALVSVIKVLSFMGVGLGSSLWFGHFFLVFDGPFIHSQLLLYYSLAVLCVCSHNHVDWSY